jgi:hypothetical protein
MSKPIQAYFVIAVAAILLFVGSFHATLKLGDIVSRMVF